MKLELGGVKPQHYALGVLFSLYLAQGLPVGFMTQALPTLLRHYGVSLTHIGVSGLLMLPWAIKFLWAPYIDKYAGACLGHYRAWILLTQSLTVVCLVALAFVPIAQMTSLSALWLLFILLLLLNLCCATQDVATDGLAVKILKQGQLHWGNTFQVMGSRFGFIVGGGAVLYAIDVLSWKMTFLLLTAGVLINSIPILYYREPKSSIQVSSKDPTLSWQEKLRQSYGYLWTNSELKLWLVVVVSFKLADGISSPMLKPMMIDMGLSLSQIGIYVTMFGAACALLGALCAGVLIRRFGLKAMLIAFSSLQAISFLYYIFLAYCFEKKIIISAKHFYLANAIEEFFSAMALVAMLSLIMFYARKKYAATDFSFQVAVMSIVSGGLYVLSGKLADMLGYFVLLICAFVLACLSILPKIYWAYHSRLTTHQDNF